MGRTISSVTSLNRSVTCKTSFHQGYPIHAPFTRKNTHRKTHFKVRIAGNVSECNCREGTEVSLQRDDCSVSFLYINPGAKMAAVRVGIGIGVPCGVPGGWRQGPRTRPHARLRRTAVSHPTPARPDTSATRRDIGKMDVWLDVEGYYTSWNNSIAICMYRYFRIHQTCGWPGHLNF